MFSRLSAKFTLSTLVFLVCLGLATILLMIYGFERAQSQAALRSVQGLEKQGGDWLLTLAQAEANASAARLQPAADLTRSAAQAMVDATRQGVQTTWDSRTLQRGLDGFIFDINPKRGTEVMASPTFSFSAIDETRLQESSVLDAIFPALLQQYPDAVAIYYISTQSFLRYYPVVNLSEKLIRVTDWRTGGIYIKVMPGQNPERKTVWFSPYLDEAGQGLLVTASSPVYDGDAFLGSISVDVSLNRLVDRLTTIRPTAGGYAFLVDANGQLVAAPNQAYTALFGADAADQATPAAIGPGSTIGLRLDKANNPDLRALSASMEEGEMGLHRLSLGDQVVFLAYAPLPGIGWSIALVSPISEITAVAASVTESIRTDARQTVQVTLLGFGLAFLLAAAAMAIFSRSLLTRPIAKLAEGVRAITAGRRDVTIPVNTQDELGLLAATFNQMTGELAKRDTELEEAGTLLEQRVADRTYQLTTLLDTSQKVAATLHLLPLLELVLDQIHHLVVSQAANFWLRENGTWYLATSRGEFPAEAPLDLFTRSTPLIIHPNASESTDGRVSETLIEQMRQAGLNCLLYLPLVLKDQVNGVILLYGAAPDLCTAEDVKLAGAIANQASVAIENAQLYEQAQQLAALQERQRLARELHDSVSQALYGIALGSRTARTLLERDLSLPDAARQSLSEPLDYVLSLADAGLAEMRALIFELRPESLETEGLVTALQKQAAALHARYDLEVEMNLCDEPAAPLPVKEALYRITQESFNNIVKHAHATRAQVSLEKHADRWVLQVSDNGLGFDTTADFPGHLGLKSMRERVERFAGRFLVESAPGQGTRVRVEVPA